MRRSLFIIIFIGSILTSIAQQIDPVTKNITDEKYYPENKFIKKNRIKYIVDSNRFISPNKIDVRMYDTLGRAINNFYNRSIDSTTPPFVYKKTGDTLIRLKFYTGRSEPHSFERFVYNQKGQIVSYLECANHYQQKNSFAASYDEFYYDENNALKTKLFYHKSDYPGIVSEIDIPVKNLELYDVIYYSFKTLKNGNKLIIGKHALGKPEWRETDSSIFDKQKRIIRFNSYALRGTSGEMVHDQLNRITDYSYTDSSVTIVDYYIYCEASISDMECLEHSIPDKNIEVVEFNRNKTRKAEYTIYRSGEKVLKSKYEYVYY
jgi:hypothetical protein